MILFLYIIYKGEKKLVNFYLKSHMTQLNAPKISEVMQMTLSKNPTRQEIQGCLFLKRFVACDGFDMSFVINHMLFGK